jgi:predicted RNA binding protein YcfA (HicA-like mRNA interferase family)
MIASLPEITYKELIALLKSFGLILRGEGSPVIVGRNRKGMSFTVHHHPGKRVRPQKLAKILKHIGVSHKEF